MKFLGDPSSGSYQSLTHSRNRWGQYVRTRATPVNPNSSFQGTVRARLALNSAAWRGITANQKAGWTSLGLQMVRTDHLGQSYNLDGFAAFCSVRNNLAAAGDAAIVDAPPLVTPGPPATATITLSAAAFSIAYTPTPLATGARLFAYCSPQRTQGRNFEADFRLIAVSAAAAASPLVILTAYTARFGVPVPANVVFVQLRTHLGGFLSGPLTIRQVVS